MATPGPSSSIHAPSKRFEIDYTQHYEGQGSMARLPGLCAPGKLPYLTVKKIERIAFSECPATLLSEVARMLTPDPSLFPITVVHCSNESQIVLFDRALKRFEKPLEGRWTLGVRVGPSQLPLFINLGAFAGQPDLPLQTPGAAQSLNLCRLCEYRDSAHNDHEGPHSIAPSGMRHWVDIINPNALPLSPGSANISFSAYVTREGRSKLIETVFNTSEGAATIVDVNKLRVGDAIAYEYPFQWAVRNGRRRLSSGPVTLPLMRPTGNEWEDDFPDIKFARSISEREWAPFLRALEGCYVSAILPFEGGSYSLDLVRQRMKAKAQKATVSSGNEGQERSVFCFSARKAPAPRVSILGDNLVFTLPRSGGEGPLFLVDAPSVCALYLFDDCETATKWALRDISFQDARALARSWFPHRAGWERSVDQYLRAAGVIGY